MAQDGFRPSRLWPLPEPDMGQAKTMDAEIIGPAETQFDELVVRSAETLKVRPV